MKQPLSSSKTSFNSDVGVWFDNLVAQIRVDQVTLETNTADLETKELYHHLISGDSYQMGLKLKDMSSQALIEAILKEYISALASYKPKFTSLAFHLANHKILVWAVISDDDESSEDAMFLAEAKANGKFFDETGICIDSTIVEFRDHLEPPPHYQKVQIGSASK